MKNRQELVQRIKDFTLLEPNWYSKDYSNVISEVIINKMITIINNVTVFPEDFAVAPLPNGGIRCEWSKEGIDYLLTLDVPESMYFCVLHIDSKDDVDAEYDTWDIEKAVNFIEHGDIVNPQFIVIPWAERVAYLNTLEDGWLDGAGKKIKAKCVVSTHAILHALSFTDNVLPGIFPMEDGGVQLEWFDFKRVMSIEITADGTFNVFYLHYETDYTFDEDKTSIEETILCAKEIFGKHGYFLQEFEEVQKEFRKERESNEKVA